MSIVERIGKADRELKNSSSAFSFMPFNLQIFLPSRLIPMKHVESEKKSLSPASEERIRRARETETEG